MDSIEIYTPKYYGYEPTERSECQRNLPSLSAEIEDDRTIALRILERINSFLTKLEKAESVEAAVYNLVLQYSQERQNSDDSQSDADVCLKHSVILVVDVAVDNGCIKMREVDEYLKLIDPAHTWRTQHWIRSEVRRNFRTMKELEDDLGIRAYAILPLSKFCTLSL